MDPKAGHAPDRPVGRGPGERRREPREVLQALTYSPLICAALERYGAVCRAMEVFDRDDAGRLTVHVINAQRGRHGAAVGWEVFCLNGFTNGPS